MWLCEGAERGRFSGFYYSFVRVMSGKAYIRHILSIYSAYIGTRWKGGGREVALSERAHTGHPTLRDIAEHWTEKGVKDETTRPRDEEISKRTMREVAKTEYRHSGITVYRQERRILCGKMNEADSRS